MTALGLGALVALGLLGYTYLGYPVAIALLARLRPLATRRDPRWRPLVTACIPVHDGAATLPQKLASLLAQDWPPDRLEILVYSDGSTDETCAIVREAAAREPRIRLLEGAERRGKPTALNRMRALARGEVLLLTDVRQPLEPGALSALCEKLADPAVGCVSGNLVLEGPSGAGAYWRYESWIRRSEARFRGMVGVTGPLYALRRADLPDLPRDLILDDVWIPMRLRLQGRRILLAEEAVARDQAFADPREFGRKVRTLAGNFQLFARLPRLLLPVANPSWFETASHKLARLACPFALVGLGVTTVLAVAEGTGPAGAWRALAAAQAAAALAALLGPRGGRLCALARTFAVLNAAALLGLWRFLRGSQRVTW